MRNLLRFFIRNYFLLLFIGLEVLSLSLVIQNNKFHKAGYINFTHRILGNYHRKISKLSDYFHLRQENTMLQQEVNMLYNECEEKSQANEYVSVKVKKDSVGEHIYTYYPVRIINNSTNKQYNYITLNKGKLDSIEPEMGVITKNCVVGIVSHVTNNYSTVLSLLNGKFHTSAKIKKNNYYGPLSWSGKSYDKAILNEIPHHVDINVGDTIITSGYSTIFPEGVLIGTVESYRLKDGNFYELTVQLLTDFKNLTNAQVIKNSRRKEILQLEEETRND